MKFKKYKIVFKTGQVEEISAMCRAEAIILAQAEQIKKGNNYEVEGSMLVED